MTIVHHADEATLMSFAAGTLPEALSAVVATHLAVCPRCRKDVDAMDLLGSVLLSRLPPSNLSSPAPRAPVFTPERVDEGDHVLVAIDKAGDVPAPISRLVGSDLSGIQWRRLGLGVWHLPLALSEGAKGDLRLIKVAPGQCMPEHSHGGAELSLILDGSYTDKLGRFGTGDLADLGDDIEHSPVADKTTGCICLIASEERAKFTGFFARLVQPLVGL
jgi:putative transcriptional regulator